MKRENGFPWPTGLWLLFGPILGCMWLAAVNYSNNLVYGVLYLVGSLCFVSIFHTWRNLAALQVEHVRVHPAFAGGDVCVELHLRNTAKFTIFGLVFARPVEEAEARPWLKTRPLALRGGGSVRIAGEDSCVVELTFPAGRRGLYRLESLLVRSSYPFGLFWYRFRVAVDAEYFVYPQAKGQAKWPALQPAGDGGSLASAQPGDDFAGVRAYMPGESLRHVDWKAYARGRPLSVKQFTGGEGRELWLDGAALAYLPLEERLSQLAFWVINAEKEEIPYALRWGKTLLPPGIGPTHARLALETLAVGG